MAVAPPGKKAEKEKPVRSTLGEQVRNWASDERIMRMLDEIENYSKKHWFDCPHCKKRFQSEIPDDNRKLEALLKLIEQVEGKPGTADAEPGGITIIVERNWPVGDDQDSEHLRSSADTGRIPPQ